MKTSNIVVGAFMLMATQGCRYLNEKPKDAHLTVIVDLTDTLTIVSEFELQHIKDMLPDTGNDKQGVVVTLSKITDTRYTQSFTEVLASHSEMGLDDYGRVSEVKDFFDAIEKDIAKIKKNNGELKQSYVFHALFEALNDLSCVKDAGRKQLVILSDLGENSPFFSVYKKKDFALLTKEPDKLKEKIQQEYPLEHSLKGINVFFIHQTGIHDDVTFHEMATLLQEYLEEHGAHVEIASSFDEIKNH